MSTRPRFLAVLCSLFLVGSTHGCTDEVVPTPVEFRLVNESSRDLTFPLRDHFGSLMVNIRPVGKPALLAYDPPQDCWSTCGVDPRDCDQESYGDDPGFMLTPGAEVRWEWSGLMTEYNEDNRCFESIGPEPGRYRVEIHVIHDPKCGTCGEGDESDTGDDCIAQPHYCAPCEPDETGVCSGSSWKLPSFGEDIVVSAEFDFPTTQTVELRFED
jgi:hypothetical protein